MLLKRIKIMKQNYLLINKWANAINKLKNIKKLYFALRNNFNQHGMLIVKKEK